MGRQGRFSRVSDILFDTNILIDALKGIPQAGTELRRPAHRWISRMTWIEVMAGADAGSAAEVEAFLDHFSVVEIDEDVGRRAAAIRSENRSMKLPDAIIWASAQAGGLILATRNTRDFPESAPGVRVPYKL